MLCSCNSRQQLPGGAALADADATLLLYSDQGLELELGIANAPFTEFSFDASDTDGDFITRIGIVNQGPANSAVVLGEISITPEPTSALLAFGPILGLVAARRRR